MKHMVNVSKLFAEISAILHTHLSTHELQGEADIINYHFTLKRGEKLI